MKVQLKFSGHDKFYCRQFWLKKGIEHINNGKKFNDEAVNSLGVGRNMVNAIRFWVNAFGLTTDDNLSEIAKNIILEDGLDPFIEDIGTVWLLHYNLVCENYASLYWFIFNEFLRDKIEFTKEMLFDEAEIYCRKLGDKTSRNSIENDVKVFIENYKHFSKKEKKGIEARFSGLLYELSLLDKVGKSGDWYKIENTDRQTLDPRIVLFCILYKADIDTSTFSFRDLLDKDDSVGRVFCLSPNGLNDKLQRVSELYPDKLVFTDNAGVKVLQIRGELNSWDVLKDYYGS